jgi:Fe-S-cluster containining protein
MNPTHGVPEADLDTANIHLSLLGNECVFPVEVRLGKRTPMDLLPAARELTMQAMAVAVAGAQAQGRRISCRAGCGACCRQLVAVSVVEAMALAELVATLPTDRQHAVRARFVDALRRLESDRLLDADGPRGQRALLIEGPTERTAMLNELGRRYFRLQIACPFLVDEACSIHPDRPLVCREYHVTSPAERCARLNEGGVEKVEPPLHMGGVLARTVGRIAGTGPSTIPLILALEWAETNGLKLRQEHDGLEMFKTMLGVIDEDHDKPFEQRA